MAVPPRAAALFDEGAALERAGDLPGAFASYEAAVETHPDYLAACKALARLSLAIDEIRAFQNWCHEASRIDPMDPEPYAMLGGWLARRGRRAEALETLRHALTRRPLPDGERAAVEAALRAIQL